MNEHRKGGRGAGIGGNTLKIMNEAVGASPRGRLILSRSLRIAGDVALYAFGVVVSALAVANVPAATHRVGDVLHINPAGIGIYLMCLIAWGSVFVRRLAPLVPLIAGAILAAVGTEYVLLLVGAYSALVSWPARRRRQVAVAVTVVVIAFVARELLTSWGDGGVLLMLTMRDGVPPAPDDGTVWILVSVIAGLALLVTFGSAMLVRTRRESRAHLHRADQEHSRAASLSTELDRRSERERLARDIHDALAHRLSVISLQSGALEEAARSQDESVARAAETLRRQAHASLEDLRSLLGELRREPGPTEDDEAAIPPSMASMRAIGHLIRSVRAGGVSVDAFVLIEDAEHAGAALDRTAYRIVQESLTNALKHAPKAPIAVYVEASASTGVRIRVSNPVLPAAERDTTGSGRGTTGIRERAQLLGGTAWIGEHDGQFIVDVSLPWHDGE